MAAPEEGATLAYRSVLVPLDGSPLAAGAVPTALALAERLGAELHGITVTASATNVDEARDAAARSLAPYGITRADRLAAVVAGDVVGAIERHADEIGPCLVCLSTRGRGRLAGAVIGSVAASLLQRAKRPVVAVGEAIAEEPPGLAPRWPRPLAAPRLVACVDGSRESETVLPVAAVWAARLGMRLTILTVAQPVLEPLRAGAPVLRRHGPDGDPHAYVDALAAQWSHAAPGVEGRVHFDPLSPADGIRAHLEEEPAGLVAIASHARLGRERLIHGAESAKIVRLSIAPVLVVPPES